MRAYARSSMQLDLAELHRVALRLQRDRAAGDHPRRARRRAAACRRRPSRRACGSLVLDHRLAVDLVPDHAVAVDFDLARHPLVAVKRLARAVRAVRRVELALVHHVRARRAEVAGRPFVLAVAAEELHLDRHGKLLILPHRLGRLAVDHHAAVAQRPPGAALGLLADEAVLEPQHVVRERLLVEQVAEAPAERARRTCRTTLLITPSSTRNVSPKLSPSS